MTSRRRFKTAYCKLIGCLNCSFDFVISSNLRIGVKEEELRAVDGNKEKERELIERILLPNFKV